MKVHTYMTKYHYTVLITQFTVSSYTPRSVYRRYNIDKNDPYKVP